MPLFSNLDPAGISNRLRTSDGNPNEGADADRDPGIDQHYQAQSATHRNVNKYPNRGKFSDAGVYLHY